MAKKVPATKLDSGPKHGQTSDQTSPVHRTDGHHGHSHQNGSCQGHNHGSGQDDDGCHDDDHDHDGPTQIPYYIVICLIVLVWGGFMFSHFVLENRSQILLQGRDEHHPYELPTWLPFSTSSALARGIYHLTPFSLHPAQWITFALISWCFFLSFIRVTYTDPGVIDPFDSIWGFHKQNVGFQQQLRHETAQRHFPATLPQTIERKHNGARRYCRKTNTFKPDRAHYCHATNRLVKRLDHYCIFLSASVGYNNHKFFVLFLFWLVVMAAFIGIKMFIPMMFIWRLSGLHLVVNIIIGCFGLATSLALSMFFAFHIWLMSNSLTTIESGEKYNVWDNTLGYYRTSPFNVGFYLNFVQVFGHGNILTWFLPVHPTRLPDEDGTIYPIQRHVFPGTSLLG